MSVPELVRAQSECTAKDLVAEADPEDRYPGPEHGLHDRDRVVSGRRVAGAVGEEDTIGADCEDVSRGARRRKYVHVNTPLRHEPGSHRLDAEVDRRNGEPSIADSGNEIGHAGAHLAGEVGPCHGRAREHLGEEFINARLCEVPGEYAHPHRAPSNGG